MPTNAGRLGWRFADLLALAMLVVSLVSASAPDSASGPGRDLEAGQEAVYRRFEAQRVADGFVPVGPGAWLHVQVLAAGPQTAIRVWGSATGNGTQTLWLPGSDPRDARSLSGSDAIAWESSFTDPSGLRHERRLFPSAAIVPHCVVVGHGPCGIEAVPDPQEWLTDAAWTDGSPYGNVAGQLLRRWDDGAFPALLAAESGAGWTVFEKVAERQRSSATLPAMYPPPLVSLRPATPWLFNDDEPAPRIATSLGNAWERASEVAAWREWWQVHPGATVVGVMAPREHVLEDTSTIEWTLTVAHGAELYDIRLADTPSPARAPALVSPYAGGLFPEAPPIVTIRAAEPGASSPSTQLPDLRGASYGWSSLSEVPRDVAYVFYEHLPTGVGGSFQTFVGGWHDELAGATITDVLSGVLYDAGGTPVGYTAQVSDATPAPAVSGQGTTTAQFVGLDEGPVEAYWWTGLAVSAWVLRLPAALLFSKVRGGLLENDTRRRIVEAVTQEPGKSLVDVARELRAPHARIQYHLRILRLGRLVDVEAAAGRTLLFPWKMKAEERQRFRRPTSPRMEAILEALRARPGMTVAELAQSFGVGETLIARYLRAALTQGVVAHQGGRPARWQVGTSPLAPPESRVR